jgi:type IV pilus assembly protein PilY1
MPLRARTPHRLAALAGLAALAAAAPARAQQADTNPALPNVMLLLDNSGSMERMIDGTLPEDNPANNCNCDPSGTNTTTPCNWASQPSDINRWGHVIVELTGSFKTGYNCVSMPRASGGPLTNEYQINHKYPYDADYYLNYHRPVVGTASTNVACVYAPGKLPGAAPGSGVGPTGAGSGDQPAGQGQAATDFPSTALVQHDYNNWNNTCDFDDSQNKDGVLDSFRDMIRVGLMTFDQDPDPGTGVSYPGWTVLPSAFTGQWSYGWNDWRTNSPACPYVGYLPGCPNPQIMAVGARNPAAPPWEGRMVMLPATDDMTATHAGNDQVQQVILSTRPFGGTPLDGMFYGARYYYWYDPNGPDGSTAAQTDPRACSRKKFIILLTDGVPNLDLRPQCQNAGGTCPFPETPDQVAYDLSHNWTTPSDEVETFVIGFAVSSFNDGSQLVNCSTIDPAGPACTAALAPDASVPSGANPSSLNNYQACCELAKIAVAGTPKENTTPNQPYFADDSKGLRAALDAIFAQIAQNIATARTTPSFSPTVQNASFSSTQQQTAESIYYSSFIPTVGIPWAGDIQRQRLDCTSTGAQAQAPVTSAGDDFNANLNSQVVSADAGADSGSTGGTPPLRYFLAYNPDKTGTPALANSSATIRPYYTGTLTSGDWLPPYSATAYGGTPSQVIPNIAPDALGIPTINPPTGCQYYSTNVVDGGSKYLDTLSGSDPGAACRTAMLDFLFGQPLDTAVASKYPDFFFQSRVGNALGDIYHAVPAVVGPPNSLLEDPGYIGFRKQWNKYAQNATGCPGFGSTRETMVYAATNDGLLHAFWADECTQESNERWAFVPPAVMPNLKSSYPSNHEFLLDGSPITKDVVFDRKTANAVAADSSVWHTVLLAGFGAFQQGYYALDVTNPSNLGFQNGAPDYAGKKPPPMKDSSTGLEPGPLFLWQLTTVPTGDFPIFASQGATPAIATLNFDPGDGAGARDIGVAILPGGTNGPPASPTACAREQQNLPTSPGTNAAPDPPATAKFRFPARSSVRCWGSGSSPSPADLVPGRALTIARLDTGEIVRVFGRANGAPFHYQASSQNDFINHPAGHQDALWKAGRVNDVPLDSPLTGTPIVYPSDVGSVASKVFIGDEDGTIWRFDLSDKNPANWYGELFLDLYNTDVDTSTTSWQDGQPFRVDPVLSHDTNGNLVLNVATGTGSEVAFDTSGTYYLYSINENIVGSGTTAKARAYVNWFLPPAAPSGSTTDGGPPQVTSPPTPGERAAGPMAVFNSTMFVSTFAAPTSGSTSSTACAGTSGTARVWGMDYVAPASGTNLDQVNTACATAPDDCVRSYGGVAKLQNPNLSDAGTGVTEGGVNLNVDAGTTAQFVQSINVSVTQVLPGLGIEATPACATLGSGNDTYVGGSHGTVSSFTPTTFSLVGEFGASGTGGTTSFNMSLPPPPASSIINSWGSVIE